MYIFTAKEFILQILDFKPGFLSNKNMNLNFQHSVARIRLRTKNPSSRLMIGTHSNIVCYFSRIQRLPAHEYISLCCNIEEHFALSWCRVHDLTEPPLEADIFWYQDLRVLLNSLFGTF